MPDIRAFHHILHDGKHYQPGDLVKGLNEKDARRLVDSDAANYLGYIESAEPETQVTVTTPPTPILEAVNHEDYRTLIDENYNLDELKDTAKEFKMVFPSNIKKPNLLDLIFEEEKEQKFIDMLEDDDEL